MSTERRRGWMRRLIDREVSPDTHLIKTVVFWLLLLPPLIGGVSLAIYAGICAEVYWQFTPEAYNLIIKNFKMPLGVMGLSIPLAALSAAIHRSVQTSRQIKEQYSQNIFSNHLEHRNYFFRFIEDFNPFTNLDISVPKLYEKLFPRAVDGGLEPDKAQIDLMLEEVHALNKSAQEELEGTANSNDILLKSDKCEEAIDSYEVQLQLITGKPPNREDLLKDHALFNIVAGKLKESVVVADGIIDCANFHRNYMDKAETSNYERIVEIYRINGALIKNLHHKQSIYQEIRAAFDEYVDKNYKFKADEDGAQDRFKSRLSAMQTNLRIQPDSEILRQVIFNYFNSKEQRLLKENAPATIQAAMA
ncbi:hypothetical protein [Marinobacter sp.]|uniref:hypothetical protein n=1 Tax=Marinobacter sp. TaxID=50741 RepID=UPI003A8EC9AF